jgi:hypothetical protein
MSPLPANLTPPLCSPLRPAAPLFYVSSLATLPRATPTTSLRPIRRERGWPTASASLWLTRGSASTRWTISTRTVRHMPLNPSARRLALLPARPHCAPGLSPNWWSRPPLLSPHPLHGLSQSEYPHVPPPPSWTTSELRARFVALLKSSSHPPTPPYTPEPPLAAQAPRPLHRTPPGLSPLTYPPHLTPPLSLCRSGTSTAYNDKYETMAIRKVSMVSSPRYSKSPPAGAKRAGITPYAF